MKKNIQKYKNCEKGFTLIEMAIAMVILSLLIGFATVAFSGLLRRNFEQKTFADIEIVADAIAVYAQKHMRVPCPADPLLVTGPIVGREPFGAERGSAPSNGTAFGACNSINAAEGIIPFATLGLPLRMAKDRFGNFITYRVSVTSSLRPVDASAMPINNWCMTEPYWYADTDNSGASDSYVNSAKAAFCCGTFVNAGLLLGVTGDVVIQGSYETDPAVAGGSRSLPNLTRSEDITINGVLTGVGFNSTEYTAVNTPPSVINNLPPSFLDLINGEVGLGATVPPSFPAYVLVSHGKNGSGAYNASTGIRGADNGSAAEQENTDNDFDFFASDRTAPLLAGAGNQRLDYEIIDDLVFWQTPSQILGRIGGVSCSSP